MAVESGQEPRKSNMFDADLIIRPAGDAAITTLGGDFSAPDYESAVFDLGEGQFMGRVVLQNLALTLDGAGDNIYFISLASKDRIVDFIKDPKLFIAPLTQLFYLRVIELDRVDLFFGRLVGVWHGEG